MIITTGIPTDRIVPRLEIRDLLKDEDLRNLYLLALEKMQTTKQNDPLSWFQIAGIHGRPYNPYDNVGEKGTFEGYCTHNSVLFPSWHRPYLALFEQIVYKNVFEIAHSYFDPKDRKRYIEAAERFRIPYWDWAADSCLPEFIASHEKVSVYDPYKGECKINNPLYAYNFHLDDPAFSEFGDGRKDEHIWETWQATLRYPTGDNKESTSQAEDMQAWLDNHRSILRERTYNLLRVENYDHFSNDGITSMNDQDIFNDNIESIHGQIHGLVGRNGHMGVIDYAAFDPVFWLHHTNVDRIFAIWQALHPDIWIIPTTTKSGTFTKGIETVEDSKTELKPFRSSPDKFWDSDGVRDTTTFKYTYPELANLDFLSEKERQAVLCSRVNDLYGPTFVDAAPKVRDTTGINASVIKHDAAPQKFDIIEEPLSADHYHNTETTDDDKPHYHEWILKLVVEKYAINTSFFVHVFLGPFSEDPSTWAREENLVGSHFIFTNNATHTGCGRCIDAHERRMEVGGAIPLTSALMDRLDDKQLEPTKVVDRLKKDLHWRIQRHNGEIIDLESVPSLNVSVAQAIVEIQPTSGFQLQTWKS